MATKNSTLQLRRIWPKGRCDPSNEVMRWLMATYGWRDVWVKMHADLPGAPISITKAG